jgi:hypothetical protein
LSIKCSERKLHLPASDPESIIVRVRTESGEWGEHEEGRGVKRKMKEKERERRRS